MTAGDLARALGGRKFGDSWMSLCPAHDDRRPSLSIRDSIAGKLLVHCHAGCRQERVIDALRQRRLWPETGPRSLYRSFPSFSIDAAQRTEAALAIWRSTSPAKGTLVEAYLGSRSLGLPRTPDLRFHVGLRHRSGSHWPAMVALVTDGIDGTPSAIHRTFLAHDGGGKAPVDQQKMMLGPCRGGVVRLADPDGMVMVGEGIETCIAAMEATGRPAWAALSTSGLSTLGLPDNIRDVIVLADGDDAGEAAAEMCARRWKAEGRRVRVAHPPKQMDFSDMLQLRPGAASDED